MAKYRNTHIQTILATPSVLCSRECESGPALEHHLAMRILPPELIDIVIDSLSDDWRTLAACALVHSE